MRPSSAVWLYFKKIDEGKNVRCSKCGKVLKYNNSTTVLAQHLRGVHKIETLGENYKSPPLQNPPKKKRSFLEVFLMDDNEKEASLEDDEDHEDSELAGDSKCTVKSEEVLSEAETEVENEASSQEKYQDKPMGNHTQRNDRRQKLTETDDICRETLKRIKAQTNFLCNEEMRASQKHNWEKEQAQVKLEILELELQIKRRQLESLS